MTEHDQPDPLSQELERDAQRLQEQSEQLEQKITEARKDWEAKRRDGSVPGAQPPPPEQ